MNNVDEVVQESADIPLGKISSIIRLRVNSDGEGVRSVVFLYGCPLNCIWCCNPETRYHNLYKESTPRELFDLIARDIPYFLESNGGITFSGGEPLVQYRFIKDFARIVNGAFSINIETSLFASQNVIAELAPLVDHWYIDYKGEQEHHAQYTGVDNYQIRRNLQFLSSYLKPDQITMTYPLIPSYTDTETSIMDLIELASKLHITQVELHPHRPKSEGKYKKMELPYEKIPPLNRSRYEVIKQTLQSAGLIVNSSNALVERNKCNYLKNIRRLLCEKLQIPLSIAECKYVGRCTGTCPKCENELSEINAWLKSNVTGL